MIHRFINVGDVIAFSILNVAVQTVVSNVYEAVREPPVEGLLSVIDELELLIKILNYLGVPLMPMY